MTQDASSSGRRIVIAAGEVPGFAGASASAYGLFRKLQSLGEDVHLVNLIDDADADYFQYVLGESMGNPDGLGNVFNCVLNPAEFFANPTRTLLPDHLDELSPDVMLCVDAVPAMMCKQSRPGVPVIFLACDSEQARLRIRLSRAANAISMMEPGDSAAGLSSSLPALELEAMRACDLTLADSELTRDLYRHFYPELAGKVGFQPAWCVDWIVENAERFRQHSRPFTEREIDVLFISGSWSRKEENLALVEQLASDCRDLNILIVGTDEAEPRYARCTGFISDRDELFKLMGNARTVVSAAALDTASGTLFEASVMGCNVIASKNCGHWRLCHADLVAEPYQRSAFVQRIRLSLQGKFTDNLGDFLEFKDFNSLVDTLAVL